jgi:hypothetical protein
MSRLVLGGLVLVSALAVILGGVFTPVSSTGVDHGLGSAAQEGVRPSSVSGGDASVRTFVPTKSASSGPGIYSVTFNLSQPGQGGHPLGSLPTGRAMTPVPIQICVGCGSSTVCNTYNYWVGGGSFMVCCTTTWSWWGLSYSVSCETFSTIVGTTGTGSPIYSAANIQVTTDNTSVTFHAPNGTYWYLIHGSAGELVSGIAPSGNITVNGKNVSESFDLVRGKTVGLQYAEKGLIAGTNWCVGLFGLCSASPKIPAKNLSLTPGTYPFWLGSVAGYSASALVNGHHDASFGWVKLSAHLTTISVKFTPLLYSATLNETGLASGATWHLSITCSTTKTNTSGCDGMKASGSDAATTTGGSITLSLRNGTYVWKITPIKGYTLEFNGAADPTWSGTFSIVGGPHPFIGKVTLIK